MSDGVLARQGRDRDLVGGDFEALGIEDARSQPTGGGKTAAILERRIDLDHRVLVVDVRRRHRDAVEGDVNRVGDDQPYRPDEAPTGVPPRVAVGPRFHADRVGGAIAQIPVEADRKGRISGGAVPDEVSVDIDRGRAIHGLEFQQNGALAPLLRRVDDPGVLPGTTGEVAGRAQLEVVSASRRDDRVVRDGDLFGLVVAVGPGVASAESPAIDQAPANHRLSPRWRCALPGLP